MMRSRLDSVEELQAYIDKTRERHGEGAAERLDRAAADSLASAARHRSLEVIELLLSLTGDVGVESFRALPLGEAAAAARADVVRRLLAAGADPDQRSSKPAAHQKGDGDVAIVQAIQAGSADAVRALLEGGAAHTFATLKQRTPLEMAEALGRGEIASLLVEAGAGRTEHADLDLMGAARRGALARVRALLPDATRGDRVAAAQKCLDEDAPEALPLLVEGLPVESLSQLLANASYKGDPAIARLLLDAGADASGPSTYRGGRQARRDGAEAGGAALPPVLRGHPPPVLHVAVRLIAAAQARAPSSCMWVS